MDRRLVDHLVNSELVSRAAMQRMILRATKNKTGVVEQLLSDDKVDEATLAVELATYYGLDTVVPDGFRVNETALKFISKSMADKHGVLPFAISDEADHVTVAVYNPESAQSVVESLKTATGKDPTVKVAPKGWLQDAIRHYYFEEEWAEAPEHKAHTREVHPEEVDVSEEVLAEESSEIVLDEVIVPPKPKKKKKKRKKSPPPEKKKRNNSSPKRRSSSGGGKPRRRSNSRANADSEAEVEAALDDFDAFLDSATGWGSSGTSAIPGWEEESEPDENPFASGSASGGGWEDQGGGGSFNLFDNDGGEEDPGALQSLVDQHERTIERLRRELQQQRDIISALVEALSEAGVVSKREIKHRIKRK